MKKIFKNAFSFVACGFIIDLIIMFILISILTTTANMLITIISSIVLIGVCLDIIYGLHVVKTIKDDQNK